MPGIREAIEQRNFTEAQQQIEVDAAVLKKFADYLSAIFGGPETAGVAKQ